MLDFKSFFFFPQSSICLLVIRPFAITQKRKTHNPTDIRFHMHSIASYPLDNLVVPQYVWAKPSVVGVKPMMQCWQCLQTAPHYQASIEHNRRLSYSCHDNRLIGILLGLTQQNTLDEIPGIVRFENIIWPSALIQLKSKNWKMEVKKAFDQDWTYVIRLFDIVGP